MPRMESFARHSRLLMPFGVAALSLLLSGCAWFSGQSGPKPTPLAEFRPTATLNTAWKVAVGSARGAFLQPAVLENAIFAASASGTVLRVAPLTGAVQWRTEVDATLSAGVGSDGFVVAVASPRGEVIALGADGKVLWRTRVSSDVLAPPLVGQGLVIVRSTDHNVTAFEADTGKRRWVYQRQTAPLTLRAPTEMSFGRDTVLVGLPGGRLVALALTNGAARWEAAVAEPKGTTEVERLADVVGPLAPQDRDVCAAAFQGRLMCADSSSGALRWSRELSAGGGVSADEWHVYSVSDNSHVVAFERSGGASVWRNDRLAHRRVTTPLAMTRDVAVADGEGYVHLLAPSDGGFVARLQVDSSAIVARPQAWADSLVVQTQDGTLALLTPQR